MLWAHKLRKTDMQAELVQLHHAHHESGSVSNLKSEDELKQAKRWDKLDALAQELAAARAAVFADTVHGSEELTEFYMYGTNAWRKSPAS
eukprot:COSAG01_NODE_31828_length_589_cov_10.973523_1_plen_90_part_00